MKLMKGKITKKLLSVALSLMMVMTFFPTHVVSVYAESTAFEGTSGLAWELSNGNKTLTITKTGDGDGVIPSCAGMLWFENQKNIETLVIGNGVTSIGNNAFKEHTNLKYITIPDSVTSIEDYAFDECESLETITIPDSVTSIGNNAFFNCVKLGNITIPDSVTSIGNNAFSNCVKLGNITIPDSVTTIGANAFQLCSELGDITFNGRTIPTMGSDAFACVRSSCDVKVPTGTKSDYEIALKKVGFDGGFKITEYPSSTPIDTITINSKPTKYIVDGSIYSIVKSDGTIASISDVSIPVEAHYSVIDIRAYKNGSDIYALAIIRSDENYAISDGFTFSDSNISSGSMNGNNNVAMNDEGVNRIKNIIGDNYPIQTGDAMMMWKLSEYVSSVTVSFNSKGGSSVSDASANYNTLVTKPDDPTKTGYTFGGWYKEEALTNAWNFTSDKVTADTTLYARWIKVISNSGTADFPLVDGNAYKEFTKGNTSKSTLHIEGLKPSDVFTNTSSGLHPGLIVMNGTTKLEEGEDKDYTVTEGSLKVNLNKSYLDTLGVGEHTINVYVDKTKEPTITDYDYRFDVKVKINAVQSSGGSDGSGSTQITTYKAPNTGVGSPTNTGDNSNIVAYAITMASSLFALIACVFVRRKKESE